MKPGFADVIFGVDWGDEGKGKEVDKQLLSGRYKINARYNGANNAGHTLVLPDGSSLVLHALPSGVLYRGIDLYIGSGCLVDPVKLLQEIKEVEDRGYSLDGRLRIALTATVITPLHILIDQITGALVGTTGNGIGPAYADQALRTDGTLLRNIRLAELLKDPQKMRQEIFSQYRDFLEMLRGAKFHHMLTKFVTERNYDKVTLFDTGFNDDFDRYFKMMDKVDQLVSATQTLNNRGFINHDMTWLTEQVIEGENVLFEGAQGAELDVSGGPVPFVTSSHTNPGFAFTGGDLSARYRGKITGVTKAIMSRVGGGPFVSELGGNKSEQYCAEGNGKKHNRAFEQENYDLEYLLSSQDPFEVGIALRILGGEYGATTGRPRRVGVFDIRRLARACLLNGVDELVVNKVDRLADFHGTKLWQGKIPMAVDYLDSEKKRLEHIPVTADELHDLTPVVETIPGFAEDISAVRDFADLPEAAKQFVQKVQEYTRTRISAIGVGPKRQQMIYLKPERKL